MKPIWSVTPMSQYPRDLWQDWDDLYYRHHKHNPMLNRNFVSTLYKHYPDDVFIAVASFEKNIQAMLLLVKTSVGSWVNYLPSQSPIALFLCNKELDIDIQNLLIRAGTTSLRIDLYSLDPQEHSCLTNQVTAYQPHARNMTIQISGNFEDYWSSRSKSLRKNMKQTLNRLNTDKITIENKFISSEKDIENAVDRYGILESQSWKGRYGTAIHPSNQQGQFYGDLLKRYAKDKQALVLENYCNDTLIASRLCILNADTLISLKTTFNEKYKRYAPGNFSQYQLTRYVFDKNICRHIDFYTNANKEKLYWSTATRTLINTSIYRTKNIEKIASFINPIKKNLKHPQLKLGANNGV